MDQPLSPPNPPGPAAFAARVARRALGAPAFQLLLGALALMAPIFLNGAPFLFTDTGTYFQAGWRALYALIGEHKGASVLSDTYLAARSPYYGVPLTLLEKAGTIWAGAALQAVAAAFTLRILARAICPGFVTRAYFTLVALLTLFSALPLFAGFMMPDVFAGFALALGAALLFYPERLSWTETLWAFALLVFSLTLHATHFMVALMLYPAAIFAAWFLDRIRATRALRIGGAALAVTALLVGFYLGLNAISKFPQRAPPFLTARVLDDGPGRAHLKEACAKNPKAYVLCAYQGRALDQGDTVLWSWDKKIGVFTASDLPTRLKLIEEQHRFVLDVILARPVEQIGASLRNVGQTLLALNLDAGFRIDETYWLTYPKDFYLREVTQRIGACAKGMKKCPSPLPLEAMTFVHIAAIAIGTLYLGLALAARARSEFALRPEELEEWRVFWLAAGFVVAGLLFNAIVCGVISGPYARYQARVAWLLPAFAVLVELRFPLLARLIPASRANRG